MEGTYNPDTPKNIPLVPATVFFHFTHLEQEKGFDVVPKIVAPRRGFRDIFGESMKQFSNIKSFATFTDSDNDIDNVERRTYRDSLKTSNDFTIHVTFKRENSFAKHVLATIFVWGLLDIIPIGYSWDYIVNVDVCNSSGMVIKSYSRTSVLSTWHNFVFLFVYPFLPSEVKIEEIYLESMQNIFKQIEAESVLMK
ncbi:MAG: hypothetical protein Q8L88_04915 [Bacteroidota bacterium]|nr:hypothetical protein [Bacteroidota bacterium]